MAKLFVMPKPRPRKDVIICVACAGTGCKDGYECFMCEGTPEIDWATYASLRVRLDDQKKRNRELARAVYGKAPLRVAA